MVQKVKINQIPLNWQFIRSLSGLFLLMLSLNAVGQISGKVFRDYNSNGVRDSSATFVEPYTEGVTIKAYNSANTLVGTQTSSTNGSYSFTGLTLPLRIEFSIPSLLNCSLSGYDYTSVNGAGNGTSVQFITTSSSNVNFAVSNPNEVNYSGTNSMLYTPIQIKGDVLNSSGTSGQQTGFVGYPYLANGSTDLSVYKVDASELGGTWGVAYSKQAKKIFTSAFVKRHVGLGPLGSGGIYMLTPSGATFSVVQFFDMDNNSFNSSSNPVTRTRADASAPAYGPGSSFSLNATASIATYLGSTDVLTGMPSGLGVIGTNSQRVLGTAFNSYDYDPAAFDQVGKVGLGGLEISEDGKYLFVMNLYSRKVFRLTLDNEYNPTSVIAIDSYTLPSVVATLGEIRPFALKYHRGDLYVGAVATAEYSTVDTNTNLNSYVFRLDNAKGMASFTPSPILNIPLQYIKGASQVTLGKSWLPWTNNASSAINYGSFSGALMMTRPTPMLTDIDFTGNQDMVLAYTDRGGHQWGHKNRRFLSSINTELIDYRLGGDILIAGKNCSTGIYTLENNGSYTSGNGSVYTSGTANNQGPGNSEFFKGDFYQTDHSETSQGALAVLAGNNEVVLTVMDPNSYQAGGIRRLSTISGNTVPNASYTIYQSIGVSGGGDFTFGKANGLGDIEVVTEAPIQLGNRVWTDTDSDGIQDAGESAIAGVSVQLLDNTNTVIATAVTDANGNYYFSNATGTSTVSSIYGIAGLVANSNYTIRIPNVAGGSKQAVLGTNVLTIANADNTDGDIRDSDGILVGDNADITFTTGNSGENNHTYDFGFGSAPLCAQPNAGLDMLANAGACINLTAVTPLTGTWIAQAGNPSGATIGTTTSGVAQVCFSNLSLGTYSFIYADGSCQDTIQVVVTPKVCLGNFVWNDVNQDGIQNNNELGVSGVTVSLLNGTTNAIISTLNTDAYGFYQFCNLNPGQYKVQFSLPANYIFTGQNAPNDLLDSDPNVFTGITDTYVLAAGDSIMTVDAGIFQPLPVTATVGDRVWFDANNNGIQDIGESGVSGITVTLYNCANPMIPVATTLSDAGGNYLFENVVAGSYQVGVSVPLGMVLTSQSNTVSDATNSDVNPLTERTSCFTVNAGDNIGYVDAGLKLKPALTSSLGDKVWNDANQNGIQDTNETGVQGVVVTLYEQDGVTVIASTTTDGLGNYAFNGINAGCYMIGFSNLPSGYAFSPANVGLDTSKNSDVSISTGKTTITCIASGQNNPTIDAGIFNNSNTNSIGDRVWYDVDQDGIQDVGEYGYPGVVITLYACATNTVMATTTTNANGDFLFSGLGNGDYYVGFGFVPGYQFTGANTDLGGILGSANSDANPSSGFTECVSLTGNTNILTVDAGIYPGNNRNATSTLGDIVWVDVNNNGLQDAGEPGVANVTVTLYESDGTTVLATTTTDGAGEYIFTNLTEGEYVVGFTPSTLPAGYTFTTQGSNIEDENNSDANTTTGKTNNITLGLGEDKLSIDAGIVAPIGTGCLGDYVWIDLDQDGIQDVNEPGVPGVTVKLYDNNTNTILQTATTNAEGKYLFCALSNGSTYSVGFENLPSGFVFTTQSGGLSIPDNSDANATTGRTTTVTLGSSNDLTLDAGIYSTTTAVIGNYVWYDEDADGIQDPTEAPIPGVLVTLYDNTNTPVASAVTDANGGYLFTNVTPGTYTIGFEGYPNTLIPTTKGSTPGADDDSNVDPVTGRTDAFTVTAGSSNLTLDAGYKANPIAGLGNYVWHDMNQNGLQDPNEAPISGVVVTVYASNGTTPLGTAITDGNGAYSFPNLTEGSYIVGFSNLPAGFTRTQNIGGLNDELNSDIDANNLTPLITLQAGLYNPNIDAGFYVGLPLSAQDLKATYAKQVGDNQAIVNWYTEDEENTSMFEVQRSLNGSDFFTVGSKAAGGNTLGKTEYALIDDISDLQNVAVLYYRVKMIDLDAGEKMSNTITLKLDNINLNTIKVYPVPFTNQLTISYQSLIEETVTVEILDMSGRRIVSSEFQLQKGSNTLMIKNLERLSASHYMLRIIPSESEQINVMRLNK